MKQCIKYYKTVIRNLVHPYNQCHHIGILYQEPKTVSNPITIKYHKYHNDSYYLINSANSNSLSRLNNRNCYGTYGTFLLKILESVMSHDTV